MMKLIWQLIFCLTAWPTVCGIAQDSLSRTSALTSPAPAASVTPTPIPKSALSLIPAPSSASTGDNNSGPAAPIMPDLAKLDQIFKQTTPDKEIAVHRAHVEWRQLKNRTVNDPAVISAKAAAEAATTDLEKRNRLRIYYETFYTRMRRLASTPEMIAYLDSLKDAHFSLFAQPRVRPTPDTGKKPEPSPAQPALPTPSQPPLPTPEQPPLPTSEELPQATPEPSSPNE